MQPEERIGKRIEKEEGRQGVLECRGYRLAWGERTLVMGILNVTPDSFSDGGRYFGAGRAREHAWEMVEQGADIIDIGGESTRPGAVSVGAAEELRRLMPVLESLVAEDFPVPISVDTYRAETAREALACGAHMLNDIWGLKADPELAAVAAAYRAPVILMHNQHGTEYRDLMEDVRASLRRSVELAVERGVPREQVVIDPGIGFGKDTAQNLKVLKHLRQLQVLGRPILLGTSRKSVIGNTLGLPVDERLEGTAATVAWGIAQGADIVRVHEVKEMVRVARMMDAIILA